MSKKIVNIFDQLKQTKILIYAIILSLLIATVGFGISMKTTQENIAQKDLQINVLSTEIGELKEENLYLYNYLQINRDIVRSGFDILNNSFNEFVLNEQEQLKSTASNFAKVKNELISSISEKEFEIKNLIEKNTKLSQEMIFQNYEDDIVNILILGIHSKLTDAMIIASINPSEESVSLIGIPRDLYINGRKINSIYTVFGLDKIQEEILNITGIYIDKYVVIDFDGFINMIDIIGGIDLYVREDIYDPYFPNETNGYTVYEIEKGSHHFTGAEALMYARSRKSTSDFNRNARQQQVVQAIRVKLKRFNLLENLDTAIKLFTEITKSIKTDIDVFEALYYLNHYQNYRIESGNVLSTNNLLYSTKTIEGEYVLLPKNGDYYEIKKQISELIKN